MKKILPVLLIFISVMTVNAQQKIRVSAMHIMQMQMRINPDDTSWRTFKALPSQFQGAPFFIADPGARFYSKEEVDAFTIELDKLLNPDKYFASQEEFSKFSMEFMEKIRTDSKSTPPEKK